MKNPITIVVGIIILVIFGVRMFTYTVKYDEVAVLTTFSSADENDLVTEPGLKFKAPWPIQHPYKYSTKLRILEDQLEEIQTKDKHTVVVQTFMTWRIDEPYKFFQTLETDTRAEERLKPLLRSVGSVISQYRFDQLVNKEADQLKLDEIESKAVEEMTNQLSKIEPGYGIKIEEYGIRRLLLPEDTTSGVFERMKTTREAIAASAKAKGESRAKTIKSEAENVERTILAFANRRADAIRAQGEQEAAQLYEVYSEAPEFALFLQQLVAAKDIFGPKTTTWVIDPTRYKPLETIFDLVPADGNVRPASRPDGNVSADKEGETTQEIKDTSEDGGAR